MNLRIPLNRDTAHRKSDYERAARIAKRAKGPAAKELAYEGWLAAESVAAGVQLGDLGVRDRFEAWWQNR